MKIYRVLINICLIVLMLTAIVSTATAQRLKPTEIVYSRLPMNTLVPPTGANSPTIWVCGQDGSNDRQITTGMEPRISDDGRFLLYRRIIVPNTDPNNPYFFSPYTAQSFGQLWLRDLANNSETMIFSWGGTQLIGYYFSPESNRGDFQIILDYQTLIWKMNLDGTNLTPLEYYFGTGFPREGDTFPVLRRGDSRIAVRSGPGGAQAGIATRTLGAEIPQHVPNTQQPDESASWSNDNQYIGFGTVGDSRSGLSVQTVYYPYLYRSLNKIKLDGSGKTQLLDTNGAYNNSNGISLGTIWTNDNSKIIVAARINGVAGLYAVKTDGSGYTQIPISDGTAPDFVGGIVQARNEQQIVSSGGGLFENSSSGLSMLFSIGEPILGDFSGGGFNLNGGFLTGVSNAAPRQTEADLQSRPNGDGYIDSDDAQQIRRFAVGLDLPFQNNEFQRADASPHETLGDGYIDADDVEQARRYSVGLDYDDVSRSERRLPSPGGPEKPIEPPTPKSANEIAALLAAATFAPDAPSAGRAVRVVNQVVASGGSVTVPVNVDTAGDETGYTFSIAFDRTKMTATGVSIGDLGGNVIYNINNTNGTVAFSVASFSGPNGTIPEATNQTLVKVNFTTVSSLVGVTTTVAFTDSPTRRKVSGTNPSNPLPQPTYTNGTTTTAGATGAGAGYAGWWAGDGDSRDISGLINNAALAPAPNAPGFAVGKVGQSYNFTAEGQYVSIPDSPSLRPQSFTIEGWAKLTGQQSNYPTVFGKGLGTGYYDSYAVWYDGNLNAGVCDLNAGCFQITAPFTQNVWHHVAFTFNDTGAGQTKTGTLYVDGVQVAAGTTNIAAGYDSHSTLIGADYDNEVIRYSWTGGLDEISLFNRALTTAEISSIFNAGQRGKIKRAATAAGANSSTQVGDATLAFANVSTAGITLDYTIDPAAAGTLPPNYTNTGLAYDISTTAAYSGAITECFHLPAITDETVFSRLKVLHSENGALVDRTTTYNFTTRTLCAQTTSLSPFVIANSLSPTAAGVSAGGRVLTADGDGIKKASVSVTDQNGVTRETKTNKFGRFRFGDLAVNATYIFRVSARRYIFPQSSAVVSLTAATGDINFTADGGGSVLQSP